MEKADNSEFSFILKAMRKRALLIVIIFLVFISKVCFETFYGEDRFSVKFTIDSILIEDIVRRKEDPDYNKQNTYSKWILEEVINNLEGKIKSKYSELISIDTEPTSVVQSFYEYYRPLNITLELIDSSRISVIVNDVVSLINMNSHISTSNRLEREKLEKSKEHYIEALKEVESIFQKQLVLPEANKSDLLDFALDLKNKIDEVEYKLPKYDGISIIVDPSVTHFKSSRKSFQNVILYGILGILTGIFLSIFIEKIFGK